MPKFNRTNVEEGDGAIAAINTNLADLETFSDAVLTRTNLSPNSMQTDLDMDSNDIINVGEITFGTGVLDDSIFGGCIQINASGITDLCGNLNLSSATGLVCINGEYCLPPTDGNQFDVMQTDGAGQVHFVPLPEAGVPGLSIVDSGEVIAVTSPATIAANSNANVATFSILPNEFTDLVYVSASVRILTGDADSVVDLSVYRDFGGANQQRMAFARCANRGDGIIHTMLTANGIDVGMPVGQLYQYTIRLETPDNGQANVTYSDMTAGYYHVRVGVA